MVMKKSDGEIMAVGHLSLDIAALNVNKEGLPCIPTFAIKKVGDPPACNFFYKDGRPMPLYTFRSGEKEIWNQTEEIAPDMKRMPKCLYLVAYENGEKVFLKIEAVGDIAMRIHLNFTKADKVVVYGKYSEKQDAANRLARTIYVTAIEKIQER